MTTCSWAAVAVLALTSICEAREVNTLLGSWSGSASGGTKFALTVADIDPNGRVAGTICSTIADGSVYGLTFSPEDEFYGVKARAKYGVLAVQAWNGLAYTYSPPPPGKATIKQAVRRTGSNAKKRLPLKRATKPTCAEEIVPRMDAVTQPVRRTAEQPLIGEWSGVWNNGPLNEVQIRKIDKRGRVTGVFCENVGTGGLRFWRFEDRQINARARGKERQRIVWIRNAAKIDERHEEVNRSGYSGDCFDCVTRPEQCAPVGDGTQILGFIPTEESEAEGGVADSAFAGHEAHSSSNRMQMESNTDGSGRNCVGSRQFR